MNQTLIGSTYVTTLDGVHEIANIPNLRSSVASNNVQMQEYLRGDGFNLTYTLDDVLKVLRNGTPAGIERLERFSKQFMSLLPVPKAFKRRQRWAEDGDESSWEREQAGHDAIWRTSKRETMRGPVFVEIASPWGGNGLPDFTWDGVVLVTLINLLELAGYRVGASLNKCNVTYATSHTFVTRVEIKQPGQPLDIGSVASVVTHGGVYELLGRASIKLQPYALKSFGANVEVTDLPADTLARLFRPGTVFLKHSYSQSDAVREIRRVLAMFDNPQ